MKRIVVYVMAACFAALLYSCKTSEENYRAAYDITREHVRARNAVDSTTYDKIQAEKREATAVVAGDSVRLVKHRVNIVDDPYSTLKRYGVVVGEYKQAFNARSFRDRLKKEDKPAYVVIDTEKTYYVIVHGFDTSAEAASYMKRLKDEVKMRIPIEKPWILARP
ncbi:MAG: SPOR domain-containing protein [Muribaculaceae bacterium]